MLLSVDAGPWQLKCRPTLGHVKISVVHQCVRLCRLCYGGFAASTLSAYVVSEDAKAEGAADNSSAIQPSYIVITSFMYRFASWSVWISYFTVLLCCLLLYIYYVQDPLKATHQSIRKLYTMSNELAAVYNG